MQVRCGLKLPVHLTAQLVVKGDCSIPASSLLDHDLKASGNLYIGAGSECKGNVVSEKSIGVGPGVHFAGIIHADGEILLSNGVHGESSVGPVAVDAGSWLYVEQGVTVRGKLSSGERVRVIAPYFGAGLETTDTSLPCGQSQVQPNDPMREICLSPC